jgi:hypothetical protein
VRVCEFELIFVWDLRIGEDFSVVALECEASIEGQTSHVRGVSSPRCEQPLGEQSYALTSPSDWKLILSVKRIMMFEDT